MGFFAKFFGFFQNEKNELIQFNDNLGNGFLDIRHLIWIIITVIIIILLIKYGKQHKQQLFKVFNYILIFMFVQRFATQLVKTIIHAENPFWRSIIPIHLCSIMIYLLPIVVIFNLKRIKMPVFFLSIIGGTMTIIEGDYFSSLFLPFTSIEGIFAHTVIATIPIVLIVLEKEQITLKDTKNIMLGLGIIVFWATIFNIILGCLGIESNYLFLVTNMLPFGKEYFVFYYYTIFLIIVIISYIFSNIKHFKTIKKELRDSKNNIIKFIIFTLIYTLIIILLNNNFAIGKY